MQKKKKQPQNKCPLGEQNLYQMTEPTQYQGLWYIFFSCSHQKNVTKKVTISYLQSMHGYIMQTSHYYNLWTSKNSWSFRLNWFISIFFNILNFPFLKLFFCKLSLYIITKSWVSCIKEETWNIIKTFMNINKCIQFQIY